MICVCMCSQILGSSKSSRKHNSIIAGSTQCGEWGDVPSSYTSRLHQHISAKNNNSNMPCVGCWVA